MGGQSGTGTITDDDSVSVKSVSDATEVEGTDLVHTVEMSGASGSAESYSYSLDDVTAIGGSDYTATADFSDGVTYDAVSGKITVPAGVTKFTVTYGGMDDNWDEGDETYTVTVGGVKGTGTITDNDNILDNSNAYEGNGYNSWINNGNTQSSQAQVSTETISGATVYGVSNKNNNNGNQTSAIEENESLVFDLGGDYSSATVQLISANSGSFHGSIIMLDEDRSEVGKVDFTNQTSVALSSNSSFRYLVADGGTSTNGNGGTGNVTNNDGFYVDSITATDSSNQTGYLIDSGVEGIDYTTSSGLTGLTGESGSFNYKSGDTVTFSVGGVVVGTIDTDNMNSDSLVFLQDMAETVRSAMDDGDVQEMAVFLQSLDSDDNPYNGISISEEVRVLFANSQLDIEGAANMTDIKELLADAGIEAVDEQAAMKHVSDTLEELAGILTEPFLGSSETLQLDFDAAPLQDNSDNTGGINATVIDNFTAGEGGSVLDLSELLHVDSDEIDTSQLLHFRNDNTNTVVSVSNAENIEVTHRVIMSGHNLISEGSLSDQEILNNLLDNGKQGVTIVDL